MTIVNLTPHPVRVLAPDGITYDPKSRHYSFTEPVTVREEYLPSGILPRCTQSEEVVGSVNGTDLMQMRFGAVTDLPDPAPETMYIVSSMVAQACPMRHDLLVPAHLVRNEAGVVLGCLAFAVV